MKQIIVVEGRHDLIKIKEVYPDSNVLTTNGREISQETLAILKKYSQEFEIILFLDPDSPGERIRKEITNLIPNCKQAFLPKHLGISKNRRKVGIEHASNESIIEALSKVYQNQEVTNNFTLADLYNWGLVGQVDSKKKRDFISLNLNIGAPNAKTFLQRLNQFGITKNVVEELLAKYE